MTAQTASTVTLELENLRDSLAPLFHRYPQQTEPQSAFIEITEEGTVSADWNGEIGNAIPCTVYHGRTLRVAVSPRAKGADLARYLSGDGLPLLERVHQGHRVEWDGSNNVGHLDEDAAQAFQELEGALQEMPEAIVWPVAEYLQALALSELWPVDKSLSQAVELLQEEADREAIVLDGSMETVLLARLWEESDWPSDLAKAGQWDDARRLWENWKEAARAAGHQPRDLAADVADMADAVEALFPEPMADLSHFANGDRRECLAERNTEAEARATLAEGLRWLKEERSAGRVDLSWLPEEVRTELAGRRMKAVEAWDAPSMP